MEKHPVKHHSYLSANSLLLKQDDSIHGFSRRHIRLFVVCLVGFVLVVTLGWRLLTTNNSQYAVSHVDEAGYSFAAQFYKDATIEESHGMSYLVNHAKDGTETSLWVAKLDNALSCKGNPGFDYTPAASAHVESSCYSSNRLLFVADVTVNDKVYQINLSGQKPIDITDAKTIFSSVTID